MFSISITLSSFLLRKRLGFIFPFYDLAANNRAFKNRYQRKIIAPESRRHSPPHTQEQVPTACLITLPSKMETLLTKKSHQVMAQLSGKQLKERPECQPQEAVWSRTPILWTVGQACSTAHLAAHPAASKEAGPMGLGDYVSRMTPRFVTGRGEWRCHSLK